MCIANWVLFRAADMNAAVNIYKGLIGLNGVHLPHIINLTLGKLDNFYSILGLHLARSHFTLAAGSSYDFTTHYLFSLAQTII